MSFLFNSIPSPPSSWSQPKVNIKVEDVNLKLDMTTLIGLTDLAEDEVVRPPLPVEILLRNIRLHVNDDRPATNITSPGPQPINLVLGELKVLRDKTGQLNVQPAIDSFFREEATTNSSRQCDREKEIMSLSLILKQLKLDNESLKKQIVLSDKQIERNR